MRRPLRRALRQALAAVGLTIASIASIAACARRSDAQDMRGTVRDSASRLPIPGAVVTLLDSIAEAAARTISNERGQFRAVLLGNGVRAVRVVRLGFRPAEVRLPAPRNGTIDVEVVMVATPMALQPIRVTASASCPRRRDRALALALLDQARAGLLATMVARSDKPARMVRLHADRAMDGTSRRIVHQSVRIDSAGRMFGSFGAARTADDFVRDGFATDTSSWLRFFGPDAEILIDDRFSSRYCFHVMEPDAARPNQVGLGFRPADRGDRIDIDGALWVDTVARALVDIDYRYVGIDERMEPFHPGGYVSFATMPNGLVVIDRWSIRVVGVRSGASDQLLSPVRLGIRPSGPPDVDPSLFGIEGWGELARGEWPDGSRWRGRLGTVRLRAVTRDGSVAPGTVVRLVDTDYRATADSAGMIEIADLLPGPYTVSVIDSVLATLDLVIGTPVKFVAVRDSIVDTVLRVPTTKDYVDERCGRASRTGAAHGTAALIGRVETSDGRPIPDVTWTLRVLAGNSLTLGGDRRGLKDGGADDDGIFQFCGLRVGENVEFIMRRAGYRDVRTTFAITKPVMTMTVEMQRTLR